LFFFLKPTEVVRVDIDVGVSVVRDRDGVGGGCRSERRNGLGRMRRKCRCYGLVRPLVEESVISSEIVLLER